MGVRLTLRSAITLTLTVLWALSLLACAGSTAGPAPAELPASNSVKLALTVFPVDASAIRVELSADDAAELYQLSCRLTFDPSAVHPLQIRPGSLVDERATFFTSTRPENYVPIAFTYHPGEAIPSASGTVAAYEFEVLNASANPGFSLLEDSQYLLAADWQRNPLPLTVEVGQ